MAIFKKKVLFFCIDKPIQTRFKLRLGKKSAIIYKKTNSYPLFWVLIHKVVHNLYRLAYTNLFF